MNMCSRAAEPAVFYNSPHITIVNKSRYDMIVSVKTDPNSVVINQLAIGGGLSGFSISYGVERRTQVIQGPGIVPAGEMVQFDALTSFVIVTAARKLPNGTYSVIKERYHMKKGDCWTATDNHFDKREVNIFSSSRKFLQD